MCVCVCLSIVLLSCSLYLLDETSSIKRACRRLIKTTPCCSQLHVFNLSKLFLCRVCIFFVILAAFAYSSITLFLKFMSPPRVVYFIGVCVPVVLCLGAFLTLENGLGIDFVIVDRLRLTRLFHKLISSFEFCFALFCFVKSRCCTLL